MEQILHRLSEAIRSAIIGTEARRKSIPHVLHDLTRLETRPMCLKELAYGWCSAIYENRRSLADWKGLLLTSLEIGFRHLDPQDRHIIPTLTHTEHHPKMIDIVLGSQESESIADLLHAWSIGRFPYISLGTCTEHLVCLHNLVPFSSRLRRLVIRSVSLVGYRGFERVGVERFVGLLNHLHVTVEDMVYRSEWLRLLLVTLQTSEAAQRLSHWYWELLAELTIPWSLQQRLGVAYNPQTVTFLAEAQEWNKLECWMGIVWALWPPEAGGITEEDLGRSILLLFRQRPGAFEKLQQWMERWSQSGDKSIPESFQRICGQAQEIAQRDTP